MKRIIALALFILISVTGASSQAPEPTPPKSSGAEVWQTFELAKGNFKILLPSKPSETMRNENGITNYLYTVALDRGMLMAGYSELGEDAEGWSAEASESFYKGFWEGFSNGLEEESKTKIKLESQEKVVFAGNDGIEFKFLLGQFRSRFLITKKGRRAYCATVFATDAFSREDQENFFHSYKILTPAKTEPAKP